jgi:hypothetical protein
MDAVTKSNPAANAVLEDMVVAYALVRAVFTFV